MFQNKKNNVIAQKFLFIDAGILNQETLLKDLQPEYHIIKLESNRDPIVQITDALSMSKRVQEVILVVHARSGQIAFSNYELNLNELHRRSKEFEVWQDNFINNKTRICIYACELASGKSGRGFIQQLKNLTGAEIAASSLPIGRWAGKQNWNLDFLTKPFDVLMPFQLTSLAGYQHTLASILSVSDVRMLEATTSGDPNFLRFEVILSEAAATAVTLNWRTLGGTANQNDLSSLNFDSGALAIAAGQTSTFINVRINADATDEADESVVLELIGINGATFAGGEDRLSATGIILDDDGTSEKRALLVSSPVLKEGDAGSKDAVFTVKLSRPAATDLVFDYQTVNGSAVAGSDYTAISGTLTFLAGQTEAAVHVPVNGDMVSENSEYFLLSVRPQAGSVSAIGNGADGSAGQALILDDDASAGSGPVLSIRDAHLFETSSFFVANALTFEVVLSEAASSDVTVSWRSLAGTANQYDFINSTFASGTLTIAAGKTNGFITLPIATDSVIEADESVIVELTNIQGAEFAGGVDRLSATGILLDDDGTGEKRALVVSNPVLREGDAGSKEAVFTVKLSRPAATDLTFDYQTVNGSAVAGSDYTAVSGTLTFLAGQTEAAVHVPVNGDTVPENSESFSLSLRPQAGSVGAIGNGTESSTGQALILDDDATGSGPVLSMRDARMLEATTSGDPNYLRFEVILSEAAATAVTLNWRTLGGTANQNDLSSLNFDSGALAIAAGQTSTFINVRINADATDEADESVVLELIGINGATFAGGEDRLSATGIILDDDGTSEKRALLVSSPVLKEGDAGSKDAVFTVKLSRPAATDLVFDYQTVNGSAVAGSDYTAISGTLTFLAGQTEAAVHVPVNGDMVSENSEYFLLSVRPQAGSVSAIGNGADGSAGQALILDDDASAGSGPVLSIRDAHLFETSSFFVANALTFEVVLSEAASSDVTVSWRSLAGTANQYDFINSTFASGTLTIAAGKTNGFITLPIATDSVIEADESVIVELTNIQGAEFAGGVDRLSATGILLDDDGTGEKRALVVSNPVLREGDAGSKEAVFTVKLSRPAATDLTFDYQTVNGSAVAGSDYTAVSGTLTFLAGQTEAAVHVPVNGDTVPENSESFSLSLRPQAGSVGAIGNGTESSTGQALILDDDATGSGPVLSMRDARMLEATTSGDPNYLRFEVILSEAAATAVTLNWRTLGGTANQNDLSSLNFDSGALTIAAGQTSAFVNVRINADATDEADESVVLELTNINGATFAGGEDRLSAMGIILDDDGTSEKRALLVSSPVLQEGDAGSKDAVFTVKLSRPAATDLVFDYQTVNGSAVAGSDYTAVSETLTFLAGQTEAAIRVPVNGDYDVEADETFNLSITPQGGGATVTATATIISDDTQNPPVAIADSYATINGLPLTVNATFGVLSNDTDIEGSTLTASLFSAPSQGTLNLNADGSFIYTPGAGFTGVDSFTYRAFDGIGYSAPTSVPITVSPIVVSSPNVVEGNAGTQQAVFSIKLSQPLSADLVLNYQTVDGSAVAGSDYTAANGTLTIPAGQTQATIAVAINGDTDLETDETFTLAITPQGGGETFQAIATIISDDTQNPPVANPDAYTVASDTTLTVSVLSGILANDTDTENDSLTASLVDAPSQGVLNLNADGSFSYTPNTGFTGTDTFTYRAFDGTGYSAPATVAIAVNSTGSPSITGNLTVPDSLYPAGIGTSQLTYQNNSSAALAGVLVLAKATGGGLLADPLTGEYADSIFLLGLGDGVGAIEDTESGTLSFHTRMADAPKGSMTVSAAIADPSQTIDWAVLEAQLKPESMSATLWHRIYTNFQSEVGNNAGEFIATLAENGQYLSSRGVRSDSATAALSFELEQAGDFGSLVERATEGTAGRGWAFLGDLRLDIAADGDAILQGSTLLGTLFTLNAAESAYYTVSSSVGQTVGLSGNVLSGVAPTRPVFNKNINGSYTTSGDFDGQLIRTADGYRLENAHGDALLFDQSGAFVKAITVNGLETNAAYDAAGRIAGFIGPNGNALTINRDAAGNVVSMTDANGQTITLGYSTDGDKLVAATGTAGTANFSYDGNGDLSQATAAGGPDIDFVYDSAGRLASVSVAGGIEQATFSYDPLGGYTVTDNAGRTAHISLAPGGQVAAITDGTAATASLLYSTQGELVGVKFPDGTTAALSVDNIGRPTALTDANGATLAYTYHDHFNVPVSFTDANGATRSFAYNDQGEMVQATWADGTHLDFGYNANGQITGFSNRRGESATYDYDARGRLTTESAGTSGAVSYTYDAAGNLLTATTAAGTTALTYDAANRITKIEYPNGRSLSYTYDAAGNRTAMTDQDGKAQFYQYDAAGRLVNLSNNNGTLVSYSYDAAGNLIREDNGNGTATTYSYDAAGRLLEIFNLDAAGNENSRIIYSYDSAGQRIGMEIADGSWTYGYDAIGQLTSAHFTSTRIGLADKQIDYVYDAAGNRISQTEDGVTTHYTANALNQYVTAGNANLSYDADGNLIAKTDTSGTWNYTYDLENRLTSVTTPTGDVTQYEYDVFGNRAALIENGVRTEFLIDPFGLGNVIGEYAANGALIASYAHGLGLAGRIAGDGSTAYYDIDGVGSVIGITDGSGAEVNRYGYTPLGNELFEDEVIANNFEFNGALGVSEDANDLNYMRARFYDSEMGRFLSEDPLWLAGEIGNLYIFNSNNPISLTDPNGERSVKDFFALLKENYTKINSHPKFIEVKQTIKGLIKTAFVLSIVEGGVKLYGGLKNDDWNKIKDGIASIGDDFISMLLLKKLPFAQSFGGSVALEVSGVDSKIKSYIKVILEIVIDIIGVVLDISAYIGTSIGNFVNWIRGISSGEPHLQSFDGYNYDFQGVGEFALVHGTDPGLEIQVRQESWGNSNLVSVNTAVAMQVGDDVVGIYLGQPNPVNINGDFVAIADGETVAVGDGSIYRIGHTYVVTNEHGDGFWARLNSSFIDVGTFLSTERSGEIAGLLGNADGDRSNDIALADGTVLTGPLTKQDLYGAFADSWRVTPETSLFVYGDGESTETFTNRDFPSRIVTVNDLDPAVRAAAEEAVRNVGLTEGTIEFENAVLDVALTGDIEFAQAAFEILQAFGAASTGLSLNVGGNAQLNEGDTFNRLISFTDDADSGNDGRTYNIDWGDGSPVETGAVAAGSFNFNINHLFADGDASHTVSITIADGSDDSATQQFTVNVDNVAPTITLSGATEVNTGVSYTLNLGAITDPGLDTVTSYIVNWGDGGSDTYNSAGEVTHTFAVDGHYTISVDLVDEDGTHTVAGTLAVTVNTVIIPASVSVNAGVDAVINEGSLFTRTITFNDGEDAGADGWTYSVDWGDGSVIETGSIAAGVSSFDISRFFADGDASHTVSVTVTDTTGDTNTRQFVLGVNNVAPVMTLIGDASVDEGSVYTLTGSVFDPGADTVTDYIINWGDGTTTALTAAAVQALSGNVNHVYADGTTNPLISVDLVDEDGTHTTAGTLSVAVNNVAPTIAISGASEINTGTSYTLNLGVITDPGLDSVTSYIVNWGDGGSDTYNTVGEVTHTFVADGDYTISVDLVDEDGTHTVAGTLAVTVNTVIIPASVSVNAGVDAVINEGSLFTRTITFNDGEDAGADGWTYSVDWGDGSVIETGSIAAGVSSFDISRFFADGDASHTVSVTVTDTTGDTNTRQFVLGVNNVAPMMTLIGDASVDEGSVYTLTGSVIDPGADTITDYIINWGDGTTTALTAAAVQALSGNVNHVFADGASNPLISVDLVDEDGTHTAAGTLNVAVNNVAPTIAISGAAEIDTGASYTLNLGAITDPGDDTVTTYIVNWGDGTVDTLSAGGDVSHVYLAAGNNTITVDLIDEDGTHVSAGNLAVSVNAPPPVEIIRIGDAPLRVSRSDPNAWENAWTDAKIAISHKADYLNNNEVWSNAAFHGNNAGVLSGGDIFGGDLGVSGQTLASSTIRQEIDGTEALRFDLDQAATKVTIDLSRLDGNNSSGHFDAGRLQLLDDAGLVVDELIFNADAFASDQQITLEHDSGFSAAVLTAGVYNGADFIFGGLSDATGQYLSDPQNLGNGAWNASEYLVDAVEFEFGEITLVGTAA
jgi:RHS repeat-associated protein